MRRTVRWVMISAVITALAAPCFGADDQPTRLIGEEPFPTTQRLDQIEAQLIGLSAQVDALRPPNADASSRCSTRTAQCASCSEGDPGNCCHDCYRANGCDVCTRCGACCKDQRCRFYAGYALVFVRPYFTDGVNYVQQVTSDIPPGSGNIHDTTYVPFSYDFEVTPRTWVGYAIECGFGIRARYWQFDHGGDAVDAVVPVGTGNEAVFAVIEGPWGTMSIQPQGEGIPLSIVNRLELQAGDFELTQQFNFRSARVTASAGLRYARIYQAYSAETTGWMGSLRSLSSTQSLEALGPTIAVQIRRPLGPCGLAVFADARGSVVFGESHIRQARVDLGTPSVDSFTRDALTVVGVGELQFGLEWSRRLANGSVLWFQGAYEGQLWHRAGSPSHTTGDLGFEGFSFALGFAR